MGVLDEIDKMPKDMKDDLRKDKELWLKIRDDELERTGNHAEAEVFANKRLKISGKVKIDDQTMNGNLVSEMDKMGL